MTSAWTPGGGDCEQAKSVANLGSPKTKASVRTVHLAPFLVDLLAELRASQAGARHVFTHAQHVVDRGPRSGRPTAPAYGPPAERRVRDPLARHPTYGRRDAEPFAAAVEAVWEH